MGRILALLAVSVLAGEGEPGVGPPEQILLLAVDQRSVPLSLLGAFFCPKCLLVAHPRIIVWASRRTTSHWRAGGVGLRGDEVSVKLAAIGDIRRSVVPRSVGQYFSSYSLPSFIFEPIFVLPPVGHGGALQRIALN